MQFQDFPTHALMNITARPAVVFTHGEGSWLWDHTGKRYLDFLSAYSAVNQGHVHPKILETFIEQSRRLTITSRAVYSSSLGRAEQYMNNTFGYDKTLFMNSGVEGG